MTTIRKGYADTSAGQIHFRHLPGPETEVPLVFFHRAPATSLSFVAMMEQMTGDRPLYAFDMPGFGASFDPPSNAPRMTDFAGWMNEALDYLGLHRVHIFAHHTGTHMATEMTVAKPARVATLMLNGIAYLTAEERASFAPSVKPPVDPDADGSYLTDTFNLIKSLFPAFDAHLTHEETVAALRSHFTRHLSFDAVWAQDYPATLAKVTCPILATCAEDEVWRYCFDRVFVDHPEAERVLLGPAKFFTPELDAPRTVAVIRDFLRRQAS